MRKILFIALILTTLPLTAQFQRRQWGVRGGLADGEAMIGGEYLLPVSAHILFTPNVELSTNLATANADLAYGFELRGDAALWVGVGAAMVHPDESDLDFGVNAFLGIGVSRGAWYPYAQVKATKRSGGDRYTTAAFGVRF